MIIAPPPDALGSTEWIGLRRIAELPLELVAYLLMLPDLCEAYRRIQSGKRHARMDPEDFLDLLVEVPESGEVNRVQRELSDGRGRILGLREQAVTERERMDALFG